MRKSKQDRIRELMALLDTEDDTKFGDMTEEEVMGELYLAKKIAKKKEEEDETVLYCSIM